MKIELTLLYGLIFVGIAAQERTVYPSELEQPETASFGAERLILSMHGKLPRMIVAIVNCIKKIGQFVYWTSPNGLYPVKVQFDFSCDMSGPRKPVLYSKRSKLAHPRREIGEILYFANNMLPQISNHLHGWDEVVCYAITSAKDSLTTFPSRPPHPNIGIWNAS
ncbi:hypothetical protein chiPu_0022080 [Chiloscyllium punctatum]|uniref:Uncharacterized protein n=1 Tax=Chiloscyllium punctatum TaxID=137246 RepID=A0A401RJJ3_CHIPU|nr:hypothetical protein [Chiloscyllium punctatum]